MVVSDIPRCLAAYVKLFSEGNGFQATYSGAWHPNQSPPSDPILALGPNSGIYLYSAPGDPKWDLGISENNNSLWYIGKSRKSVRSRVWRNLGALYEKDHSVCIPKFKYHRWADDQTITDIAVKEAIATGNFVAYGVAIMPIGPQFAPEIVETFLLTCFYRSTGTFPVLNSLISQFKIKR